MATSATETDSKPDSVNHKSYSSIPFMPEGVGPTLHETIITKGDGTFTGVGWSREEADQKAGEKYNAGERD